MKKTYFYNRHLNEANESYVVHFIFSIKAALTLITAGLALFIHAIVPFLFTTTASRTVKKINDQMQHRARNKSLDKVN